MLYLKNTSIMKRVQEHLDEYKKHYDNDWFLIAAQGSMNYELWEDSSDIDTKILVFPTLDELVFNKKPKNKVHIMPDNGEHLEVRDIREYWKIFKKSNINFVEILFSNYVIFNPVYLKHVYPYYILGYDNPISGKLSYNFQEWIAANREKWVRMNPYAAVCCMSGMAKAKYANLCHATESRKELVDKYGYDSKNLMHLMRIGIFLNKYIKGEKSYKKCIDMSEDRDYLLSIKHYKYNLDDALKASKNVLDKIDMMINEYINTNPNSGMNIQIETEFDDVLYQIMHNYFQEEYSNE